MDDAKFHAWLLDLFNDAQEASATARENAGRDIDYRDNKQWTEAEARIIKERGQPVITVNKIRDRVAYYLGLERSQETKPNALPRNPTKEDEAHAATDALRFIADQTRYRRVRSKVWEDIITAGWGGMETTIVPGRGRPGDVPYKIVTTRCRWDRMFWDPHSQEDDFSDASYRGTAIWMDRDEAIRQYGEGAGSVFDETVTADDACGFGDRPLHQTWVARGSQRRVRIVQMYYRDQTDGQWSYAEFTRGGILLDGPSPWMDVDGKRVHAYDWQSCYIDRDNNRFGVIRDLVDLQDEINKRRSKALHAISTRQTFGRAGVLGDKSVKDLRRELARPDGHVELAAGVEWMKDFGIIPTGDMSAGNLELLQQATAAMETMGPNAAMLGKQDGAPSGRALLASQQGGQVQIGPVTDALRDLDLDVFTRWWITVQQFWTSETWIRIEDDQNALQWVALNQVTGVDQMGQPVMKNNVGELDVDIIIDEAPAGGSIADESFQTLIQLKQMDQKGEIPFSDIIAAAPNLRNKQELVKNTREREQQPPNPLEIAGAQAKIGDVQAGAALKAAKAQREQSLAGHDVAKSQLDQANARKVVVQTHSHATDSVRTALDIAQQTGLLGIPQPPAQAPAAGP